MDYILNLYRVEDGNLIPIGSKCGFNNEEEAKQRGLEAFKNGECDRWQVEVVVDDED